jgi:hypothetical protein
MHYSGHLEPEDDAMSFLPSSQQEAVVRVSCIFRKKGTIVKGSYLRAAEIEKM